MKTEAIEECLDAAETLAEDACETCESAIRSWYQGDRAAFVRQIRAAVSKLGCAVVALDAIASECERLRLS